MMQYVCLDCRHVFGPEDVFTWRESRGEYWGAPCYETMSGCPCCRGDYVVTYQCACCHEWIDGTYIKLESGDRICEHCYITYELGEEG